MRWSPDRYLTLVPELSTTRIRSGEATIERPLSSRSPPRLLAQITQVGTLCDGVVRYHRRAQIGSRFKGTEALLTECDLDEAAGRFIDGGQNNRIPGRLHPGSSRGPGVYAGQVTDTRLPARRVESPPVSPSESQAAARPDDLAVTAGRCAAQLLGGDPAGSAEEVAGRLLAIQAQDLRGARLTVRARSAGRSASDVDSALIQQRSLIVTWLNRGTLHLVRTEDYWWLHPLTTPQLRTGNSRTTQLHARNAPTATRRPGCVTTASGP